MSRLRTALEHLVRNRSLRRRLPAVHGGRPIWVSPDARLRYLRPGTQGFEQGLLAFVGVFVQRGQFVLDVGANVGEFALAAAHRCGSPGHVLAIEPDPFLASLYLRTSREPANADLELTILTSAVSSHAGIEEFSLSARGRASNALSRFGGSDMGGRRQSYFVSTTTIDAISAQWNKPDIIKIDVEGAELAALQGAAETMQGPRPLIYIEVRKHNTEITDLFQTHDYRLFDPADTLLSAPLTTSLFDTLAVPFEKVRAVSQRNRHHVR
jgi:FkbM family methyltransferase